MADYSQTITNRINFFGLGPCDLWGIFLWGQNWANGTIPKTKVIGKFYDNDITPASSQRFDVVHLYEEALPLTSLAAVSYAYLISNILSIAGDMASEGLKNKGYNYIFTGNTIEGENRVFTTYTVLGANSTSFTVSSATGTTWT